MEVEAQFQKKIQAITDMCDAFKAIEHRKAGIIRKAAKDINEHCETWGAEIREHLEQSFKAMQKIGFPPPFVKIAGLKKEPPLNNLLEWWAKSDSEHGMTKNFLISLSELLCFQEMVDDLKSDELGPGDVLANQKVPLSGSDKRPDLAVRTKNTALILENKYGSKESGEKQYAEYRDKILPAWAGARKAKRAVFCCPEDYPYNRPPEDKWCCKTHEKLAILFLELAKQTDGTSHWGRMAAIVTATAFDKTIFPYNVIVETDTLLKKMKAAPRFLAVDIYAMLKQSEEVKSIEKKLKEIMF